MARFDFDYCGLNEVAVSCLFPRVDDTVDELKDTSFNTHLDLASSFLQYRAREEDVHKTAFQRHDGLMEWVAMAFEMCDGMCYISPKNE
jgi:hypothetical protein